MARPRVFISSTYYDLKQTRENLAQFLGSLGYDAVRNEHGDIPYGNEEDLEKYCYKEINNIDIFVSIIGGRFGSEAKSSEWSISNEELRTALKNGKQVYIFIEKSVDNEYNTYLLNKDNADTKYNYVDNVKIYQFLEEIHKLTINNNIKAFESSAEIQDYLKEQFAGLFQSFLDSSAKRKDFSLSKELEELTNKLGSISSEFDKTQKDITKTLHATIYLNHPVVLRIAELLDIQFGIWFDNLSGLNSLMLKYGWTYDDTDGTYHRWVADTSIQNTKEVICVSRNLFEANNDLKALVYTLLDDDVIKKTEEVKPVVE